jgi:hypothetical protein
MNFAMKSRRFFYTHGCEGFSDHAIPKPVLERRFSSADSPAPILQRRFSSVDSPALILQR